MIVHTKYCFDIVFVRIEIDIKRLKIYLIVKFCTFNQEVHERTNFNGNYEKIRAVSPNFSVN
jgi:hypothetical protein